MPTDHSDIDADMEYYLNEPQQNDPLIAVGQRSPHRPYGPMGDGSTIIEKDVWKGKPSQWISFEYWIISIFGSGLIFAWSEVIIELSYMIGYPITYLFLIPPVILIFLPAIYKTLQIKFTYYRLTTQRLLRTTGILSTVTDEIELHRIRDLEVRKPLHLRVLGLGNILIKSRDLSTPIMKIEAIKKVDPMRDMLRHCVIKRQKDIGWRETEVT